MEQARFIYSGAVTHPYAILIKKALEQSLENVTKLPQSLFELRGMSGRKYRMFINNLISEIGNPRYLEIGSWGGSTLCSAIFENDVKAIAIDNWSEFDGPVDKFFSNLGKFITKRNTVSVLTSDYRKVEYRSIGLHNVFLFDGPHAPEDQYDGLMMPLPALDHDFIFIVDDWNWDYVRNGTHAAIRDTKCQTIFSVEVFSTEGDVHPGTLGLPVEENSDWHNGYLISVLSKSN